MPIRDSLNRVTEPTEDQLRAELVQELRNPKATGEPDIVLQGSTTGGIHVFVIWSQWLGLDQAVRSRIVLDAYEAWKGEQETLRVTVAMGLTPDEAKNLGIS
ncbi:MAG: hypothetical protein KIT72_16140 [Polyangiaceae bacterium]|nr:hypothetical protein [Polyangiaceae bacterium]